MDNIAATAKAYLEKECSKLIVNLERAMNRKGATDEEVSNIQKKIDINMYLQSRCE